MCVWGEARGSLAEAQRAVGFVVRNRVLADRPQFGSGWREVLLKPMQFSAFNAGSAYREQLFAPLEHDSEKAWKSCFASALIAYEDLYGDPTRGALFYYSGDEPPIWSQEMVEKLRLPGFVFLTDQP